MKRKRTVCQHVVSGLRIAGLLLLGLATFAGLIVGFKLVVDGGIAWPQRTIGMLLVSALTILLFVTARQWARWLFAIAGYSAFKLALGVLFAPFSSHTSRAGQILVWFLYALAGAGLTYKYLERKPKSIEKAGLVTFVLGITSAAALPFVQPMIAGLFVLALCELVEWLRDQRRSHGEGANPPSDIERLSMYK